MTATLDALLRGLTSEPAAELPRLDVSGLAIDSRSTRPGNLFFAREGGHENGLDFAGDAVAAGAIGVVARTAAMLEHPDKVAPLLHGDAAVPVVGVGDVDEALGVAADRFFGAPSAALDVTAVTGTNGKTTVTWLVAAALARVSGESPPVGLLGTLGSGIFGALESATHTTADAVVVQRALGKLRDAGARHAVMEASSHALAQRRLAGTRLRAAAFTNLSRDHLDYHGSFEAYLDAKRRLFFDLTPRVGVFDIDDAAGHALATAFESHGEVIAASLHGASAPHGAQRLHGKLRASSAAGVTLDIALGDFRGTLASPLLGRFNAANLLLALGLLRALDVPATDACAALAEVDAPPGRMQRCGGGTQPLVVVDYAHTPDALAKALDALRPLCTGRLWCVFGCGGDRDPGKRPLMARAVEQRADRMVVTDDNPRTEDGDAIVRDTLAGFSRPRDASVERDRARAISLAIAGARAGDIVLVAGKGHEDYQEVGTERRPFTDIVVARAALDPAGIEGMAS